MSQVVAEMADDPVDHLGAVAHTVFNGSPTDGIKVMAGAAGVTTERLTPPGGCNGWN